MKLTANNTELEALETAQTSLRSTVQRHLSDAIWIVGGSVKFNDALSPRLTGELDLDCYVVFSRSRFSPHLAHDLKEVLFNACRQHGWYIEERRFGYRVLLKEVPRLTLDIGVVRESGAFAELLDTTGYPIGPTDVLNPKPVLTRPLAPPKVRYAWLLFKAWAKASLPWKTRPNSHILRSIVAIHAQTVAPKAATWPAYVDWVTGLCDRLEVGDLLSNWQRTSECSSQIEGTYEPFVVDLRQYVRDLRHVAATDYCKVLSVANRRIRPVRVFVSSRQNEFANLRAKLAMQQCSDLQFLLAERFFPWNSGVADGMGICEAQIDHADVFLGIYGNEYGTRSSNRHSSPIEEELRHASSKLPRGATLLFSTINHSREPNLVRMLQRHGGGTVRPMFEDIDAATKQLISSTVPTTSNQSLQGTFDPSPIFAAAKKAAASSAPELRR